MPIQVRFDKARATTPYTLHHRSSYI